MPSLMDSLFSKAGLDALQPIVVVVVVVSITTFDFFSRDDASKETRCFVQTQQRSIIRSFARARARASGVVLFRFRGLSCACGARR